MSAKPGRSRKSFRVEPRLEGAADLLDQSGRVAVVEGLVVRPDAVLGAEAATEARDCEVVDERLQLGLELRRGARRLFLLPHEVQVHAAVAPVSEVAHADE